MAVDSHLSQGLALDLSDSQNCLIFLLLESFLSTLVLFTLGSLSQLPIQTVSSPRAGHSARHTLGLNKEVVNDCE